MKITQTIGIICLAVAGAWGCSNHSGTKATDSGHEHEHEHSGEHVFACPMHPQITGHEKDKCSICGMDLVHNDNAGKGNGNKYKMEFSTEPQTVIAGKGASIFMVPKIEGKKDEAVPLDTEHEKKIHFIMVSDDLSWFDHVHPEYGVDGKYRIHYTFPFGGGYTLFADYKPTGANHELEKTQINVSGNSRPATTFSQSKLSSTVDGYTLTLVPESGKFESGSLQHIQGVLTKTGKAVDPAKLEKYLGAKAHMVMISALDKSYLHVHPSVENGKYDLHTTFDKPGIYRGWLQFKAEGKVLTTDFTIVVTEGRTTKPSAAGQRGGH